MEIGNRQSDIAAHYLVAEVEGGDELHRVALLHKAAARFVREAIRHTETRRIEAAHTAFVKAKKIVTHLLGSIPEDDESDLAAHLRGLFKWTYAQLAEANLRKDTSLAESALRTLRTLGGAWAELDARGRDA